LGAVFVCANVVTMLRIGHLELPVPVIQGALSGFSDLPMRRVARAFGCVYTMNEVILDELVVLPGKIQQQILHVPEDDHPIAGQLLGSQPDMFAAAAVRMVEAGYDVIDLNFGCPVKKTVGRCRGGYLLSEPRTALEIVSRVRDALPPHVPLTLKMRRGIDDSERAVHAFHEIFDGALARGVAAICVHARTVQQKYVGPARRAFFPSVVERLRSSGKPTQLLASGDVFEVSDAVELLGMGVHGVWVGRGAIGSPWVFRDIAHKLHTGHDHALPTFTEQRRAVWMHHRECVALYGVELGGRIFRSAAIRYADAHPRADEVRTRLFGCKTHQDLHDTLRLYWDDGHAEDHFGPVLPRQSYVRLVAAGAC
jgi:tRNA-dihydrouridine synthase B